MEKYNYLNKVLKGEKFIPLISEFKVKKDIRSLIIDELRNIGITEPEYKITITVRDFRGYYAYTSGKTIINNNRICILLDSKLFAYFGTKFPSSRINLFITIFHELDHVKFDNQLSNENACDEDLIKDEIINNYFYKTYNTDDYYALNYKVFKTEVHARIKSVIKTFDYFTSNGIDFTTEELNRLLSMLVEDLSNLKNRNRINPIDGKVYDIDKLYNIIMNEKRCHI